MFHLAHIHMHTYMHTHRHVSKCWITCSDTSKCTHARIFLPKNKKNRHKSKKKKHFCQTLKIEKLLTCFHLSWHSFTICVSPMKAMTAIYRPENTTTYIHTYILPYRYLVHFRTCPRNSNHLLFIVLSWNFRTHQHHHEKHGDDVEHDTVCQALAHHIFFFGRRPRQDIGK